MYMKICHGFVFASTSAFYSLLYVRSLTSVIENSTTILKIFAYFGKTLISNFIVIYFFDEIVRQEKESTACLSVSVNEDALHYKLFHLLDLKLKKQAKDVLLGRMFLLNCTLIYSVNA